MTLAAASTGFTLLSNDVPTTVVNAATATGVAKSAKFTIQATPDRTKPNATFFVTGTFTVGTVTLQASEDGTNFFPISTADTGINIATNKTFQLTDLTPGLCYQFTVASITGTSITIDGLTT